MSTEQLTNNTSGEAYSSQPIVTTNKVDINILMEKVRAEKKKEKKENLIFLGLILSVIIITAFIASF